jgi:RND family efflux transporter MFP subunit
MSDRTQTRELLKFSGFILLAIIIGAGFFYRENIIPYIKGIISGKVPFLHEKGEVEHAGREIPTASVPQKIEGKKEKKILYWTDPMMPGYKSDKPGKSPMGMEMVPVYEEEGVIPGTIKIDPATVKSIGVRTEKVIKRPLHKTIMAVGRIDYDERRVTHIHTKIQGWVEKLYVDFTGKEVREGDVLLEVYSPELVSAQQEYLLALEYAKTLKDSTVEEVASGAKSLLESARRRLQLFDVAEHQIKELEKTRQPMKTLHIHSPTHGIVVKKDILQGMFVTPEMHLYVVTDISKIWVYADIYEYEIPWVKVGQEAEMTLSYFPGKVYKGVVTYIYPYLQAETRTVKVRMEFDNPNWGLKPDMYANVKLESKIADSAIVIPADAVIRSGVRNIIIVSKPGGVFEPRDVKIGLDTGDGYLQILEGAKEDEEIITSAQFLIDSESKLKEAIDEMRERKGTEIKTMDKIPDSVSGAVHDSTKDIKTHDEHGEKQRLNMEHKH